MRQLTEDIKKLYEVGDGGYKDIKFDKRVLNMKPTKKDFKSGLETYTNLSTKDLSYVGARLKDLNHKNINGTSGRTHDVSWDVYNDDKDSKTPSEKLSQLRQAAALHKNYIKDHTKEGDLLVNKPLQGKSGERSRIYRRYGFSDPHSDDEMQYGRVTTINGEKKLLPYHEHEKEDLNQKTKEREKEAQRRKNVGIVNRTLRQKGVKLNPNKI